MEEKVTIELGEQKYEIDIAKMNDAIDELGWDLVDSAKRNFKRGKYLNVIDRLVMNREDIGVMDKPTNEQRLKVIKELI